MGFLSSKSKEVGSAVSTEAALQGISIGAQALEAVIGFPVSLLVEGGMTLKDIYDASQKKDLIANPKLEPYGFHEGPSPTTKKYLFERKMKKIGGAAFSLVGTGFQVAQDVAGFGFGGIDSFGLAKHGVAEASTIGHLTRLGFLASKVKQSQYLTGLVNDMIKVKAAKAGFRGGKMAAAAIPNSIASNAVALAVGLGQAATEVMMKELCGRVALEVHFRASLELRVGASFGGGYGPAAMMAQELLNHTLSTGYAPTTKVRSFLEEPAGHLVIFDKLSML